MKVVKGLLQQGNSHLGESIHTWSMPAVETCPGATKACQSVCYARAGFYHMPDVKSGLAYRLAMSRRKSFVADMIGEIRRKGVMTLRIHAAGDFYSAGYTRRWAKIVAASPRTNFYFYTRSWRVEAIRPILEELASYKNVHGWFSTDRDTGSVEDLPDFIRVAYLQTEKLETDPEADLAFRSRGVRKSSRVGLPMVCPKNAGAETTCGTCQNCFR